MRLIINGEQKIIEENSISIKDLLRILDIKPDAPLAIEVNKRIIKKKDFEFTELKNNDVIEIVTFVGGG